MLKEYYQVIITADHGSSSLATLVFHSKPELKTPENAKLGCFGHFCELSEGVADIVHADDYKYVKNGDKVYFVIRNSEHFTVSDKAVSKDQINESLSGEIQFPGDTATVSPNLSSIILSLLKAAVSVTGWEVLYAVPLVA